MDLYYEVQGQGAPIVLRHSGGADKRDWQFIAPLLAQTFEVITFDGRGAGQSPPPFTPANYVEDLRQLLQPPSTATRTAPGPYSAQRVQPLSVATVRRQCTLIYSSYNSGRRAMCRS
jgi:hypothetical protein